MTLKSDLTNYATLASPALTGTPTVNGNDVLGRCTTISPAYYGAGRRIEMDVSTANTARIDFHSYDTNTSVDHDARIVCAGGVANTLAKDAMTLTSASRTFNGTVITCTVTVATTYQIPSLTGYAPLDSPAFTGTPTCGGHTNTSNTIYIYYSSIQQCWKIY